MKILVHLYVVFLPSRAYIHHQTFYSLLTHQDSIINELRDQCTFLLDGDQRRINQDPSNLAPFYAPLKTREPLLSNRHKVDGRGVIGRLLFSARAACVRSYLFIRHAQYPRRSVTFVYQLKGAY